MTRAWVFQERTVSSRFVQFTETQLLWECHSMMKSESGDIDQDWTHEDLDHRHLICLPFKYPISDSVQSWHSVVEDYSRLRLTFSKDRLPALSAIVQRMLRMRKNDTYISGLWKSSLLGDLTWRCGDTRFQREPRSAARIPSWSWTSTRGAVQYTSHNNLTLALSVDSSYDPGISLEQGYPDGVAVVLKCHSCAGWIR